MIQKHEWEEDYKLYSCYSMQIPKVGNSRTVVAMFNETNRRKHLENENNNNQSR